MQMTEQHRIPVAQQKVWSALNDPEVIRACVPGCESIEQSGENQYRLTVLAAVGPVRARFQGIMTMTNLNPPRAYNLVFEGQGGMAGFAKGDATVELEPAGGETLLTYSAKAQVGGKLAQIGSRMIDTAARKMADQFFANFKASLAPGQEPVTTAPRGTSTWVAGAIAGALAGAIAGALVVIAAVYLFP